MSVEKAIAHLQLHLDANNGEGPAAIHAALRCLREKERPATDSASYYIACKDDPDSLYCDE